MNDTYFVSVEFLFYNFTILVRRSVECVVFNLK